MEQSYIIRNDRIIGKTVPNITTNYNYSTCPIGSIFAFSSERIPLGFFICDGASYAVTEYPDLYAVIGNTYGGSGESFNVPDYRETVLVGTGKNTTDTITSHDTYGLGEFKDDQMESHTHNVTIPNSVGASWQISTIAKAYYSTQTITQTSTASGTGTVTHGKQKGVTYIIKAFHTNEGQDEGVSDSVVEYVNNKINDSETDTTSTWSSSKIASEIVGTKTRYAGNKSIDISTGGKLTLIVSSEYSTSAACYMLLSNFNVEPTLIKLGSHPQEHFKVEATHKSNGVDTITVTTQGDEYTWFILQF